MNVLEAIAGLPFRYISRARRGASARVFVNGARMSRSVWSAGACSRSGARPTVQQRWQATALHTLARPLGSGRISETKDTQGGSSEQNPARMNVFTTDHPMMSEPSAFARRVQWRLLFTVMGYFLYVLLLGPLCALGEHGGLDFVPESVGRAIFLPARPVALVPGIATLYRDYLDWWYHDPNDPYSSPDWR